ncbi:MAG: gliding motility-associated-like protein [Saprospiraceae bacterium]|jgi:gliding motility-associated-like protein
MKIKNLTNLLVLTLFSISPLLAQPVNDDCENAINLDDVSNFCSGVGAFNLTGATASQPTNPGCWPQFSEENDIWFQFTAEATDLNVVMLGNTSGAIGPGGTLESPQFAIYEGDCNGVLTLVECSSDGTNTNITETFAGPLTIGQTYYIRVAARDGNVGTFQLCVDNFNGVPEPSGDCDDAVVLCDKSPFTVESVTGTGSDPNEVNNGNTGCLGGENATTWYKWTCDVSGTLEFTLTPNNPSDDLDFAVFELPGGLDDCDNKDVLRCMASGEQVGGAFNTWEPCTGATGLAAGETDANEGPGCSPGDNNFAAAISMVAGETYALIIDNFSNTGNGFSIEFGGTGTFLGPTADFEVDAEIVCFGNEVTFMDVSTSVSGISNWEWNFGVGGVPTTAIGEGPHQVTYISIGTKSIVLQIMSEAGCVITHIENITVEPTPDADVFAGADYCDPMVATGTIILTPNGGTPPYLYDFQNTGTFGADSAFVDLEIGDYVVVIQDANGCTREIDVEIPEGLSLDPTVNPAVPVTCNGDSDGGISVTVAIGNDPITYDFGNGPVTSNTLTGLIAGNYTVTVSDGIGCTGEFIIEVPEFPPLELEIDAMDISCFGETDGSAMVIATGGSSEYSYLWNNNETQDSIINLVAGNYSVTVTDSNGCTEVTDTPINEPAQLFLNLLSVEDVICFGDTTGIITVEAFGGTPTYMYSTDGVNFQADSILQNLAAETYTVIIQDASGCTETVEVTVASPPPLIVDAGPDQTIELGEMVDIQAFHTPPFRPVAYNWTPAETLNCADCDDPTAFPFGTTAYVVSVVDSTMCRSEDSMTINVILNYPVFAPNVFSPNGDGINDGFTLFGGPAARQIQDLKVFSRWGSLVFETTNIPLNDAALGWDGIFNGKAMNPDVFAYVAEVEFIDGEVFIFKGDVLILR